MRLSEVVVAVTCVSILLLLGAVMHIGSAGDASIKVYNTSAVIIVDGDLNFTSEWNGSSIIMWRSPLNGIEYDRCYLLHNATHYLIGAVLYDPDSNKHDDSFYVYVNFNNKTYEYKVKEKDGVTAYNITNGCSSFSTGAVAVASYSKHHVPYVYLELAIPKSEWEDSTAVRMMFKHKNTYKLEVTSWYPCEANESDPSTWLTIQYITPAGLYNFTMTFLDRDGNNVDYLNNGIGYVRVLYSNGTLYTSMVISGSGASILIPNGTYIVEVCVYDVLVYNATVDVVSNATAQIRLNNLKRVEFPYGSVIGVVETPGTLESIYLDPSRQLGMAISNSSGVVALRLFPRADWNYTFVVTLNALNFTFDPLAPNLLAYIRGYSGVTMMGAPEGYPVVVYANGTVRGYTYKEGVLSLWISNGSYGIYSTTPPFAVVLNGTELRGSSYTFDDVLNVTAVSCDGGLLEVYYENPCSVQLFTTKVAVTSPYSFPGRLKIEVYKDGEPYETRTEGIKVSEGLNIYDIGRYEGAGEYTIRVTVYDEVSGKTVGTATTTFTVPEGEAGFAISSTCLLLILIALVLLICVFVGIRYARALIPHRPRKYVKFGKWK